MQAMEKETSAPHQCLEKNKKERLEGLYLFGLVVRLVTSVVRTV